VHCGPTPLTNPCPRLDGDEIKPDPYLKRLVLLSILWQHGRGERAGESEQMMAEVGLCSGEGETMKDVARGTSGVSVAGTKVRYGRYGLGLALLPPVSTMMRLSTYNTCAGEC
jgi:hypothetical protein